MPIYVKQMFIDCDVCDKSVASTPGDLPVSTRIPAWTAQGAMSIAVDAGWLVRWDRDSKGWSVTCPACRVDKMAVNETDAEVDKTAAMVAYLDRGHAIEEWLILNDDADAYIEFLEAVLAE